MKTKFTLKALMLATLISKTPVCGAGSIGLDLTEDKHANVLLANYLRTVEEYALISSPSAEKANLSFDKLAKFFTISKNEVFDSSFLENPETTEDVEILDAYNTFLSQSVEFLKHSNVPQEKIDKLVSFRQESNNLPFVVLLHLLIAQAQKSTHMSQNEKAFLEHIEGLGELSKFLLLSVKESNLSLSKSFGKIFDILKSGNDNAQKLSETVSYSSYNPSVSGYVVRQLWSQLDEKLPTYSMIPVLGKRFFNYRTLVENLINRRFLVAFPNAGEGLSAHGIDNMSPLGFTLHDLAHLLLDHRTSNLHNYAAKLLQPLLEKSASWDEVMPLVVNKVVAIDALFKEIFSDVLAMIDHMYTDKNDLEYKKTMYAFYLIMHETPDLYRNLFDKKTFEEFIGGIIPDGISKDFKTAFDTWQTSYDTGESTLTKDQLLEKNIEMYNLRGKESSYFRPISKQDIVIKSFDIHASPVSIDTTLLFDSFSGDASLGTQSKQTLLTLKQHYANYVLHNVSAFKELDPSFTFEKASSNEQALDQIMEFQNKAKEFYGFFHEKLLNSEGFASLKEKYEQGLARIEAKFAYDVSQTNVKFGFVNKLAAKASEYDKKYEEQLSVSLNLYEESNKLRKESEEKRSLLYRECQESQKELQALKLENVMLQGKIQTLTNNT